MQLTARHISGNIFTAKDDFEATLDYEGAPLNSVLLVTHSVELVSGEEITHGGGAASGVPLHHKNFLDDQVSDGVFDYTSTKIEVEQVSKGTSIIRLVANVHLRTVEDANAALVNEWWDRRGAAEAAGEEFTEAEPILTPPTTLETEPVTIEWREPAILVQSA